MIQTTMLTQQLVTWLLQYQFFSDSPQLMMLKMLMTMQWLLLLLVAMQQLLVPPARYRLQLS